MIAAVENRFGSPLPTLRVIFYGLRLKICLEIGSCAMCIRSRARGDYSGKNSIENGLRR